MRHISQTLNTMVSKTALHLRGSDGHATEADELERRLHRAIAELRRSRPRLVEFAPRRALQRALEASGVHPHVDGRRGFPFDRARQVGGAALR